MKLILILVKPYDKIELVKKRGKIKWKTFFHCYACLGREELKMKGIGIGESDFRGLIIRDNYYIDKTIEETIENAKKK